MKKEPYAGPSNGNTMAIKSYLPISMWMSVASSYGGGVIIIYTRTLCVVFGNKLTCVLFVAIFISVDPPLELQTRDLSLS